jgi:hypothetical protein
MDSQFEAAARLIRAKHYDEARQLLETIAHPQAAKWLNKLDEIAPRLMPAPFGLDDEAGIPGLLNQPPARTDSGGAKPKKKAKLPYGEPWNPNPSGPVSSPVLGTLTALMPFVAVPFWNFYLALNWQRMGKPDWMWLGLSGTIAGAAGFWLGFFYLLRMDMDNPAMSLTPVFIIMLAAGCFSVWLWLVTQRLQASAYKHWQRLETAEALYRHPYPVVRTMMLHGAGILALISMLLFWLNGELQPRTFSDTAMTLNYPTGWDSIDTDSIELCQAQEPDARCVVALQESRYGYAGVIIFEDPYPDEVSLDELDAWLWKDIRSSSKGRLDHYFVTAVDERDTRVRQYWFTDGGNQKWYGMLMLVRNADKVYRVFFYASTSGILEERWKDIESIFSSIRFSTSPIAREAGDYGRDQ